MSPTTGDAGHGPNEAKVLAENVDAAEVEIEIDLASSTAERVGLAINKTPDGHETLVAHDDLARRVFVDAIPATEIAATARRRAPADGQAPGSH